MDPKTGEFHDEEEYEAETGQEPPAEWPRYALGDVYELNGHKFEIIRINSSSLVLTPVVDKTKTSARRVMEKLLAKPEGLMKDSENIALLVAALKFYADQSCYKEIDAPRSGCYWKPGDKEYHEQDFGDVAIEALKATGHLEE